MIKKLITLILSAVLAMSCFSAFAEDAEIQNSDSFIRYCNILTSIGIETGFEDENEILTREALAELALSLMKTDEEACLSAKYTDVPAKHYAADLVYTVDKYGYVAGFDDNTFRLSDSATAYEFARVLLHMLDYGALAKNMEWTDEDYNVYIARTELLYGITSSVLTQGNAARMLYNMLKEPVLVVDRVSEKTGAQYTTSDSKTYITEKCDLLKCTGKIFASGITKAVGISQVGKGKVNIGGEIYFCDEDLSNHIGYSTEFYVTDIPGEDVQTICYIEIKEAGEEIVINSSDIISYERNVLKYYEGEKTKSEKVDKSKIMAIVNGHNTTNVTDSLFAPHAGSVRLVDYEGNGSFDAAFITSKIYYKIAQASADDYIIVDSDLKDEIKTDEDKLFGMAIDDIVNGSVVSIAPSTFEYRMVNGVKLPFAADNAGKLTVKAVENTVEGNVISTDIDGITIGKGETSAYYPYSKWFNAMVSAGVYETPALDSSIIVYVEDNEIVYAEVNSVFGGENKKYTYGYLVRIAPVDGAIGNIQVKLFTEDGVMEIYELADNFKLNGTTVTNMAGFEADEGIYQVSAINSVTKEKTRSFTKQLVSFELNAEGKLKTMLTAKDYATVSYKIPTEVKDTYEYIDNPNYDPEYIGYSKDCFSLDFGSASTDNSDKKEYRSGFNHLYTINDVITKVFVVPTDSDEEKYFSIKPSSYFVTSSAYAVKLYDVQERFSPSACVVSVSAGVGGIEIPLEVFGGNTSSLVAKTGEALADDGSIRPKLWLVENMYPLQRGSAIGGQNKELFAADDEMSSYNGSRYSGGIYPSVKFKELEAGDVIMMKTNSFGEINSYRVLTRYSDMYDAQGNFKCREINTTVPTSSMYITCAKVVDIFDDYTFTFNVDPEGKTSGLRYSPRGVNGSIAVSLFDASKKGEDRAKSVTLKELRIGDTIVTRSESGSVCEVFIFRK